VNDSVLNYLKNERELSKFNIKILNAKNATEAHKRLISIEKEFVEIPFEKMGFNSLFELKKAIALYRESRALFYAKYSIPTTNVEVELIESKLVFLKNLAKYFLSCINTYSNFEFANLDLKFKKSGAQSERLRLITQILCYSASLYIEEKYNDFTSVDKDKLLQLKIDDVIYNLEKNIFKHFNNAKVEISALDYLVNKKYINNCMSPTNVIDLYGNNNNIKIYRSDEDIYFNKPFISPVYQNYKKVIKKNISFDSYINAQNNIFAIVFPIDRSGNELCSLYYKEIYINNIDISSLFEDKISNIKVTCNDVDVYYKGIFMKPLWKISSLLEQKEDLCSVISFLYNEDIKNLILSDNLNILNNKKYSNALIDQNSTILISLTRTEDSAFSFAAQELQQHLDKIKIEYSKRDLNGNS
jgi:hypothetical protein